MSTEKIIAELERTIKKVCSDIKRKKGSVGSDKLDSLSKLINSYSRLLERHQDCKDRNENKEPCLHEILKESYEWGSLPQKNDAQTKQLLRAEHRFDKYNN